MPSSCPDCPAGSALSVSDGATVCSICGLVLDIDSSFIDTEPSFNPSHSELLKSSRSSWNLSGQNKEATHRRNIYQINEFIRSLAHALSVPGLVPRASTLFTQAMATGGFTWGNKAKVMAGACLSIALRESNRPQSLGDIAFLVQCNLSNMKRVLSLVLSALGLTLTPSEPQQHLSTLQSHLISLLESSSAQEHLPASLISELKGLSIRSAEETARSLIDLLARTQPAVPEHRFAAAPTACAVFMLALEAEARTSFSNLGHLAVYFGARFHIGKGLVMRCYKSVQEELARWSEELNWLDAYQRSSRGRAKVAKRLLVARALKEIIAWKDEIRRKNLQMSSCPTIPSELDDDGNTAPAPPRKRRKLNHAIGDAVHFLADPLTAPLPRLSVSTKQPSMSEDDSPSTSGPSKNPDLSLTKYLLASSVPVRSVRSLPSRLQLLAVSRGGSGPEEVLDEELLADDEWEAIQRTPAEMDGVLEQWRADGRLEAMEKAQHKSSQGQVESRPSRKRRTNVVDIGAEKTSKRINIDAFERLMKLDDEDKGTSDSGMEFLGIEGLAAEDFDYSFEDDKEEEEDTKDTDEPMGISSFGDSDGEDVGDWHPMSPGGYTFDDEDYT